MTDSPHTTADIDQAASQPPRSLWHDGFGTVATRAAQVLLVTALGTVIVIAATTLKTPVVALLLATILACAFAPLVRLLTRVMPRTLAALLTLLLAIGALGGIFTLVGFAVAGQASKLGAATLRGVKQVEHFLQRLGLPVDDNSIQHALKAAQDYIASASFGTRALDGLTVAGEIGAGAVLLLFVLFFLLRDGAKVWGFLISPFSGEHHARAERVGAAGLTVLGAYARGTATIAAIDAVIIGIALLILHVPLALPLAVLVFLTAFIPIIGAPLAGTLAAAVTLVFNGPVVALIVIGVIVVVHFGESHLLQPLIMGRAVSLHPLAVLLSLAAGTILGGIVGALLAVPTASVTWAAIKAWRAEPVLTIEPGDVVDDVVPGPEVPKAHTGA